MILRADVTSLYAAPQRSMQARNWVFMSDKWHKSTPTGQRLWTDREPVWKALALPIATLLLMLGITGYATHYQLQEERAEAIDNGKLVRTLLARRIERLAEDTMLPIRSLQKQWGDAPPDPQSFSGAIKAVADFVPQFELVAWVGTDNRVAARWPSSHKDLKIGTDLGDDPIWGDSLTRPNSEPSIVSGVDAETPLDLLPIVVPVRRSNGQDQVGTLIIYVGVNELLKGLLDERLMRDFNLALFDSIGLPRFELGEPAAPWTKTINIAESVQILDAKWSLRVVPSSNWTRGLTVREPIWILIVGGIVALLASGTMLQATLYRRRERDKTRQQLDALESLNQISAALTDTPEAGMEILSLLASDVKRLLRMPMVCIFLLDSKTQTIRLVYYAGVKPPLRSVFSFDELPGTRQCFEQGKVMIVSDLHSDSGPFNVDQLKDYPIRAIVLLPMVVKAKPVGVIGLSDTQARQFSELEVRMARLWGAQAGIILAQSRLYDQLRQQSETNETLLRELNHRVKNNLTGILGLLEMGRPPLDEPARRWIERVAGRVEAMARTHELFTSGARDVAIEELVNTTLASIRSIKPPGVKFQVEMKELQTAIPVERAVTLAIVLNELCYNAMVHGVRQGGAITIRGRSTEPGVVAIDVIDRAGKGNGGEPALHPGQPASSTGVGLTLVRALVGRELRGKLLLNQQDGPGTTATVEFPVDPAHTQGHEP
jgi:two-component sensor histidine kinase